MIKPNDDNRRVTFSFGANWQQYLRTMGPDDLAQAEADIDHWLGADAIVGRSVLDVGCGSGIHSWAFQRLGADRVVSIDIDPQSVAAATSLWRRAHEPVNWVVRQESVLEAETMESLGRFDLVYSWGVLHHTGRMWQAVDHCCRAVRPGGTVWLALYAKGPRYGQHLALKRKYNAATRLGKKWIVGRRIGRRMVGRLLRGQNPLTWNQRKMRGMSVYHDLIDWLGGLPYEVASADEVVRRARGHGLVLERIAVKRDGGCNVFVFSAPDDRGRTGNPGRRAAPSVDPG